jgi:uncharacterized membrane protein
MCILLPNFANTINMTRFYHVLLFFLAPLFAIGCVDLFRFVAKLLGVVAKRKTEIFSLIFMILILSSYFLFQTNFVYEVAGSESWSLPLSRYRLGSSLYADFMYLTGPQVSSAEWLSYNANMSNLGVYADQSVFYNLISYGGIYGGHLWALTNFASPQYGQFIYLAELNTVYGKVVYYNDVYNVSDLLASRPSAVTYNNGFCEILTVKSGAP